MNEGMISMGIQKAAMISVKNKTFTVMDTQSIMTALSKKYNNMLLRADDIDVVTNDVLKLMHAQTAKMPKTPGVKDFQYWK